MTGKASILLRGFVLAGLAGAAASTIFMLVISPQFYTDTGRAIQYWVGLIPYWWLSYYLIPAALMIVVSIPRLRVVWAYQLILAGWLVVLFLLANGETIIQAASLPLENFLHDFFYHLPAALIAGWVFRLSIRKSDQ